MKKIYILAIAIIAFTFSAKAQIIDDNMDGYSLGGVFGAHWSNWSGDASAVAENIIASDAFAASGTQSGFIGAGAGPQDAMLLLGNQTTGDYTLKFKMYIPAGKTGYFNLQGETVDGGAGGGGSGVFNSSNLVFNNTQSANGAPGLGGSYPSTGDADPEFSWNYPEDAWFNISIYFAPEDLEWTMTVDGVELDVQVFDADAVVGAIDFFAIDGNNEYYIDDVLFEEGNTASVNDLESVGFNYFPNPVKDVLNINADENIKSVTIFNVIGQQVKNLHINALSKAIDMSDLSSGAYFVKVTIGDSVGTIKIIK